MEGEPSPVTGSFWDDLVHIPTLLPTRWTVEPMPFGSMEWEWVRNSSPVEKYQQRGNWVSDHLPSRCPILDLSFLSAPWSSILSGQASHTGAWVSSAHWIPNSRQKVPFLKVKQWGYFLRNFKKNISSSTPCLNLIFYISIRNNF